MPTAWTYKAPLHHQTRHWSVHPFGSNGLDKTKALRVELSEVSRVSSQLLLVDHVPWECGELLHLLGNAEPKRDPR